MTDPNKSLADDVKKAASAPANSFESRVKSWYKTNLRRMQTLAGTKENADKILVSFLDVAGRNPKIMSCDFDSVQQCILYSISLNLCPGAMQECAYLPFKGVLTFVPMYQGLCKLALQSGLVRSINYGLVKEGDEFEFELGTNQFLRHKPDISADEERPIICAWAVVETVARGSIITVKSAKFVDGIRKRSPTANSSYSPWNSDYDAMALKTVLKQGLKPVPKSPTMAKAIELDNASERPDLVKPKLVDVDISDVTDQKALDAQGGTNG